MPNAKQLTHQSRAILVDEKVTPQLGILFQERLVPHDIFAAVSFTQHPVCSKDDARSRYGTSRAQEHRSHKEPKELRPGPLHQLFGLLALEVELCKLGERAA